MDHFAHKDGVLHAEDVALPRIADEIGTPVYVYSRATLERHAQVFREGIAPVGRSHIAFAIKANPNRAVLRVLAKQGYGADVVSGGEISRAISAGMKPEDVVFSGVGKTRAELAQALDVGIGQFNIELEEEGVVLAQIAASKGKTAVATLRVNPDVDAGTHAKISTGKTENKFGVAIDLAPGIFDRLANLPGLSMQGVALHIGSQLFDLDPLEAAYRRIGQLVADLRAAGHVIDRVDLGGGLGALALQGLDLLGGGGFGQRVRQQVVAGVARLDLDHIADEAQVLDGLVQEEFDFACCHGAVLPLRGE